MRQGLQASLAGKRQVVGFRYFNVYGPREQHKGRMASVAFHQFNQFRAEGKVKLFGEYGGYGPGEQKRDFVFIDDVVAVNLWFLDHPDKSGIFNLGTGRAQPFNDVALAVVNALQRPRRASPAGRRRCRGPGADRVHPLSRCAARQVPVLHRRPTSTALRAAGCDHAFADVQTGVARYMAAARLSRTGTGASTATARRCRYDRVTCRTAGGFINLSRRNPCGRRFWSFWPCCTQRLRSPPWT